MLFQSSLALLAAPETRVGSSRSRFFDESQDECEERDSIQEAYETKKACDRKRYKADFESKKDSTKAQYWLDPERKKVREGLLRSKSRTDFSLQTSSISGKSKGKEILRGRSIPFGCNIQVYSRARKRYILCVCSGKSSAIYNVICIPPPPPPPHVSSVRYAIWPMACW